MANVQKCRTCGADIAENAPFGSCPKCLLELGLSPVTEIQSEHAHERVRYFGDYELLEQIGHGGMGIVYKARQLSLQRIVALKMIAAGELASAAAVQRFHIEAEAAAKLEHPNIVQIYEVGVHRGQYYFSMKYVQGRSLAEEIRDGHLCIGRPNKKLGKSMFRRQQAAIAHFMAAVARSVHYAHQNGVLHRDLKPSNILLNKEGEPHLTDFGVAKILEHDAGVTRSAEIIGTPSYMSPEQAKGGSAITTATDVYSMGVILYELLTGARPFAGANALEVLQKVVACAPADPRLVNPQLSRDIVTICLKCLEKDSHHRYGSAASLADDLDRFIADKPIEARSISARERVWRWCRRKPALAGALASLVVIFLAGYIGVFWQWGIAAQQASRARTLDTLLKEALLDLPSSLSMGRHWREVFDQVAARKDVDSKYVEPVFNTLLGGVYLELGEDAKAEERFRTALGLERKLHGPEHLHVADQHCNLGWSLSGQYKLGESEEMHRKALELRRTLHGPDHIAVACSLEGLAWVLLLQDKLPQAEETQRQAITIRRRLGANENPDMGDCLDGLARILNSRCKFPDAEVAAREALALHKKPLDHERACVPRLLENLASVLSNRGKLADAERTYREALSISTNTMGVDNPLAPVLLNGIANVHAERGNFGGAASMHRDVIDRVTKRCGRDHPFVASLLDELAVVLRQQGELVTAAETHLEALRIHRKWLGTKHSAVAASLAGLALVLKEQGNLSDAEKLQGEALMMRRTLLGKDHLSVADSLYKMAIIYRAQRRLPDAEAAIRESLTIFTNSLGWEHPALVDPLTEFASVLNESHQYVESEAKHREALRIARHAWTDAPLRLSETIRNVATSLDANGQRLEAEPLLLEAHLILQQTAETPPKKTREIMEALSNFYTEWATVDPDEVRSQKAQEWKKKLAEFDAVSQLKPRLNGAP